MAADGYPHLCARTEWDRETQQTRMTRGSHIPGDLCLACTGRAVIQNSQGKGVQKKRVWRNSI